MGSWLILPSSKSAGCDKAFARSEPTSATAAVVAKLACFYHWPSADNQEQPTLSRQAVVGPDFDPEATHASYFFRQAQHETGEAAHILKAEAQVAPRMPGHLPARGTTAALPNHSTGLTVEADEHIAADTAASQPRDRSGDSRASSAIDPSLRLDTQRCRRPSNASARGCHAPLGSSHENLYAEDNVTHHSTRKRNRKALWPTAASGKGTANLGTIKAKVQKRTNYKQLIGKEVDIPAAIFDIQVPELRYTARVMRKDTGHPGAVVIRFKEDGSTFWLPANEVWRYVEEGEARSMAGNSASGVDACAEFAAEVLCSMSGTSLRPDGNSTSAATFGANGHHSDSSAHFGTKVGSPLRHTAVHQATSRVSPTTSHPNTPEAS